MASVLGGGRSARKSSTGSSWRVPPPHPFLESQTRRLTSSPEFSQTLFVTAEKFADRTIGRVLPFYGTAKCIVLVLLLVLRGPVSLACTSTVLRTPH